MELKGHHGPDVRNGVPGQPEETLCCCQHSGVEADPVAVGSGLAATREDLEPPFWSVTPGMGSSRSEARWASARVELATNEPRTAKTCIRCTTSVICKHNWAEH